MAQQKVYALMVGIDKYLPPVPALDGCVNDMRAMKRFLEKRTTEKGVPFEAVVLENDQATRMNIVEKFETHLGQAEEDDVAFFYYSGHGSQENAHRLFWDLEEDNKNETIVAYDSRSGDGMDLADKELATLIDIVAKKNPHILVVMDCCNSGGGTRSLQETKVRNSPASEAVRSLDSYILPRNMKTGTRSALTASAPDKVLVPLARHVALSAAQSFQLAKETLLGGSPRGVFTYSLLEVMENAVGPLSYQDIMRQVRELVTQRTYDQNPQLYARELDDADLLFLGGSTTKSANYYQLSFHNEKDEWQIDAGAIHGIVVGGNSKSILKIYAEDASEKEMQDERMALGDVSVRSVASFRSVVRPEGNLFLDKNTAYRARIHSLPIPQLSLCIRGDNKGVKAAKKLFADDQEAKLYIDLVDDVKDCDYNLIALKGHFVVTRKSDADNQPLIAQIEGYSKESANKAIDNIVHIAKWERIRKLTNPSSNLASNAVKIELLEEKEDKVIQPGEGGYRFEHKAGTPDGQLPGFRIRLTNTSGQKLYVSLLLLTSSFQVMPNTLPQGGVWMESGASVLAINGQALRGKVSENHTKLGRHELAENLKLIISTTEFNALIHKMDKLEAPRPDIDTRDTKKPSNTRALIFDEGAGGVHDDWNTTSVSVTIAQKA
ncbi:MAG: caspase family protein [Bacteroidota bacterium]